MPPPRGGRIDLTQKRVINDHFTTLMIMER
jgi:hypothetical protein